MNTYRVAVRITDLLVQEVVSDSEEGARRHALFRLARLCAPGEESTVEVVAIAQVEDDTSD